MQVLIEMWTPFATALVSVVLGGGGIVGYLKLRALVRKNDQEHTLARGEQEAKFLRDVIEQERECQRNLEVMRSQLMNQASHITGLQWEVAWLKSLNPTLIGLSRIPGSSEPAPPHRSIPPEPTGGTDGPTT